MNAAQCRRKWRRWLKRLAPEIVDLIAARDVFDGYRQLLKKNPDAAADGTFHTFVARNYGQACAVRIRALVGIESDKRDLSFSRLLKELCTHHTLVSRKSFLSHYLPEDRVYGNIDFDNIVGSGVAQMPQRLPLDDLKRLKRSEQRVRVAVNKQIAHIDIRNRRRKDLTFAEIHEAVDVIIEIFQRYYLLLFATEYSAQLVWTHDWQSVFDNPWRK